MSFHRSAIIIVFGIFATISSARAEDHAPLERITHFVTPQTDVSDDDGDGWPAWREDQEGTNPLNPDTDGDGIPDSQDLLPLTAVTIGSDIPTSTLKQTEAGPQLVVNDEPIPFMWFENMSFAADASTEQRLRRAGIRVYTFWHYMLDEPQHEASFDVLDARIEQLLSKVPDACIIVRFVPAHSDHFAERFPEEVLTAADGAREWADKIYGSRFYTTFASAKWKWMIGQNLTAHINHMLQASYRSHVIGINILHGNSGEWWWWSGLSGGRDAFDIDYSQAMKTAFERYLRLHYGDSLENLRRGWNDPSATFDAPLPTPAERRMAGTEFFDRLSIPARRPRVTDFNLAFNAVMAEQAEYFARIIKRATGGRYIVGVEMHHSLQSVYYNGSSLNWPLMDCPDIDYFSSPNDYSRKPGEPTNVRVPWASLGIHHKVFCNESDVRVHNLSVSTAEEQVTTWGLRGIDDTLAVLQRDFATLLCQRLGGYWMQWEDFWYDDPQIEALFARQTLLSTALSGLPRPSQAQIAVVADAESQMVTRYEVNPLLTRAYDLSSMGAPYDFYELADILKPGIADQYRVIIFLNIPALSAEERRQIESLKRNGRTIIWMFCPGVIDRDNQWRENAKAASELMGFAVRFGQMPMQAETRIDADAYKKWTGRDAPMKTLHVIDPRYFAAPIYVTDPAATALGRFVDNDKPALVARKFDDWTSIYCATTALSPEIWHDLLRSAGVHLYLDTNDVIAGGGSLLMIHTSISGVRTICLPHAADVVELYTGDSIGRKIDQFDLVADAGRTFFYYIGDADEIARLLDRVQPPPLQVPAPASSTTRPASLVSTNGYVTFYRVLGMFDNVKEYGWSETVMDDYLAQAGAGTEETVDPSATAVIHHAGRSLSWRSVNLPGPVASWPDLGMRGASTCYVAFNIDSPSDRIVRLGIGSDDQHMLFVNHRRIGAGTPGLIVDNAVYNVNLSAGKNLVVIKVTNRGGPGGLVVHLSDGKRNVPSDLSIND